MLTQEQSREYNRCKRLSDFFEKNTIIYQAFEPFDEEVTDFNANFTKLEDLAPEKNIVSKGITTDKAGLKHTIADALGLVCRKTYAYALRNKNAELAAQVNTRSDIIFRMRDADLMGFASSINDIITPLLTNPSYIKYGVTAARLAGIIKDAKAFDNMIGKADETSSGNTVANTAIDKQIELLRSNIKQFDLLIDEFQAENPEFVQGYHINSEVDNIGIRHSGIEGYVRTKSGDGLSGATVKLQNTTKSSVTDLRGYYHIERARPDDYIVECSAGGTTQTKLFHISKGKTEVVDWAM